MRSWILAAGLAACFGLSANAATYVIAPDGSGDYPTIQAGIDATVDGDVIQLIDGRFTGEGNRDVRFLGKAITVMSQSGDPQLCVIDCEGSETEPHRGFNFIGGEPSATVLAGVTVEGGWVSYPDGGGALYIEGTSAPAIRSCIFTGNRGAAVDCRIGCSPRFTDCVFTGNVGFFGAGISSDRCTITLEHCEFTANGATRAGAFHGYATHAEITGCTFAGNKADDAAGVYLCNESSARVIDCLFLDNVSSGAGAALTFWIAYPNRVETCTFIGNVAGSEGAALWSEKISETRVVSCTFFDNRSPHATVLAGNHEFIMENSIVAFAAEGAGVASWYDYAVLSCCDIFGNAGGDWVGTIADQLGINGNICADPLFCEAGSRDLHLDEASPCAPGGSECGLIGAWPVGCGGNPVSVTSWGRIKGRFTE